MAIWLIALLFDAASANAPGRRPCDFNPDEGTLIVDRTKNGDPVLESPSRRAASN